MLHICSGPDRKKIRCQITVAAVTKYLYLFLQSRIGTSNVPLPGELQIVWGLRRTVPQLSVPVPDCSASGP
ncbi:hypothetical protein [Paenibacillus daejeonensis]|uniref:hypothetical protein n=1 Tax=Paenibacillus daejeonensis TaxID=135193 RepID=UPI0003636319|nr:hypothetical protein [Paenibacillus daejeonensis]